MKYAKALRSIIEQFFPEFKKDPAKLEIYIREGGIRLTYGTLSFTDKYLITIHFNQFTGNPKSAMIPIIYFCYLHYPELILNQDGDKDFLRYEAKILDTSEFDLSIALEVSENTIVDANGNFTVADNIKPDDDMFDQILTGLKDLIPAPNSIPDY